MPLVRRDFLVRAAGLLGVGAVARRAAGEVEGEVAHPVEPPPALEFRTMAFEKTAMYGGASTAIVGAPRDLSRGGGRMPMIVLLPGGHHNMQRHDQGCWGWWSEYKLADIDTALRRGHLDERDFQYMARTREIAEMNRLLASTPFRGAVYVTPWVVGRQVEPAGHGAMVTDFLRQLVERAWRELPVVPTREATGLGGMSSGGLWTIYSGSACAEIFATLVATQPYTEDLLKHLRGAVRARSRPQRLRLVSSDLDHQRKSTLALSQALTADGIAHEYVEYLGGHSAAFAAGPGGLDAMLVFDRALRGEAPDGTRRLPARDGEMAGVDFGDDFPRRGRGTGTPTETGTREGTGTGKAAKWSVMAVGAAGAGIVASTSLARRRRRETAARDTTKTAENSELAEVDVEIVAEKEGGVR